MDDDSASEIEENPIFTLIDLRKQADFLKLAKIRENPSLKHQFSRKEQEISLLQSTLTDMKNKHTAEIGQFQRIQTNLHSQIDQKDSEIASLKGKIGEMTVENQELAAELDKAHRGIGDLMGEIGEMERKHSKEISELRLKHEQELYILRKLSR